MLQIELRETDSAFTQGIVCAYTLDMDGAEQMDQDVKDGDLDPKVRMRLMVNACRTHAVRPLVLGDTLVVVEDGERRVFTSCVGLMVYLGY